MNRHERRKRKAEELAQAKSLVIPGCEGELTANVPTDFDAFFDDLRDRAQPPRSGSPMITVMAIKERRVLELTPLWQSSNKEAVVKAVRRILREFGATRVAVITEAWMGRPFSMEAPIVRPSQDPLRTEVLTISVEDVSNRSRSGMFQIGRNPDGSAFLHDWQETDSEIGRLTGLLQPEPHGTVQ